MRTEQAWLDSVRALILQGDSPPAQTTLAQALAEYPESIELRRAEAGILRRTGRTIDAEASLRKLLACDPGDAATAFALTDLLKDQGRTAAAAAALRDCFDDERNRRNANLAIAAIELLDDCDRKRDAAAIAETAVAASPDDARLNAYAGMLAIQLGEFEVARRHYLLAMRQDPRACEWHVPIGLSSTLRYPDSAHPDFAIFRAGLQREGLSDLARAELYFALGKAHDDIGAHKEAAEHFRRGNDIRHRLTQWSRKAWRRTIEARLASHQFADEQTAATVGFTPLFIVGMPRTGTTLLAEMLSHYPRVCNRGELPWLARLSQHSGLSGRSNQAALRRAASTYAMQTRQDDAPEARWFIDKQPLNFRYVDLALAMFPDARIIHCQRNTRDTALSLWTQCFLEEVQGYSYDFHDIALVMRDERRLMAHWRESYLDSVWSIHYEELVTAPQSAVARLAAWAGMPAATATATDAAANSTGAINTASLWQARQPVYARSVNRWKHYASFVPELSSFPDA